jgi:hypothetical protein
MITCDKHEIEICEILGCVLTLNSCIPDDPRAEVALDMVGVVSACTLDGKNGTDELATADIVAELIAVVGWAELV